MACLLLFGLLILNVNWVQVVKAEDYRDDPRNSRVLLRTYERERGPIAVLDAEGQRQAVAESVRTDGPLEWLRTYPGGAAYAPVTGYYSLVYGRTGIERAQDEELSGDADEFFVRRLSDFVTGRSPEGGAVLLTLDQAAQAAAYEGLQGNRGAVVALDPRTGAVLAMVSLPSFDPARLSSFQPRTSAATTPSSTARRRPSAEPGHQQDLSARVHLQGGDRRGRAGGRRDDRDADPVPHGARPAADQRGAAQLRRLLLLGRDIDTG
jgi:peptidoglycan glycosyltransferase